MLIEASHNIACNFARQCATAAFPDGQSDQQQRRHDADVHADLLPAGHPPQAASIHGQTNIANTMNPMLSTANVGPNNFSQRNVT